MGEICNAYDLPLNSYPEDLSKLLDSYPRHQTLPFLSVPPLKLALKAYESWGRVPYRLGLGVTSPVLTVKSGLMYTMDRDFAVEEAHRKAVKADDAEVPVHLWNDRIWRQRLHTPASLQRFHDKYMGRCPLDSIRSCLIRYWRRAVCQSLLWYLRAKYGTDWRSRETEEPRRAVTQGQDCLVKASTSDWWEYIGGSTLFFW